MTQKEELLGVKARLEERLKDTELTKDQREIIQAGLDGVKGEIAELDKSSAPASTPKQDPTPPSVKKGKKEKTEKTDEEKAAFAQKMKDAKAAKAAIKTSNLTHLGKAKIDYDFDIFLNDRDEALMIPNVTGLMKAEKGDYVLCLEGGESFAVIKNAAFQERCTIITEAKNDEKRGFGAYVGTARIDCDFKLYVNETDKTLSVPNVTGSMEAEKGDYVLYLLDGESFAVIKKETFEKLIVQSEFLKENGHAHEAAKQVVAQMTKSGCDVHKFLKETRNTPLDAWVQGKVIDYTNGKTDEWIERIYIDQKEGDLYAKISRKSILGWFSLPRYVRVCPERGIETIVDAAMVEGRKYRIQYGRDKLKILYHYPDDIAGCRSLAKEIYEIRRAKGDSSGKYRDYVTRCQNPQWRSQYRGFVRWMHTEAAKYRENRPSMSHGEALKAIGKELRIAAK